MPSRSASPRASGLPRSCLGLARRHIARDDRHRCPGGEQAREHHRERPLRREGVEVRGDANLVGDEQFPGQREHLSDHPCHGQERSCLYGPPQQVRRVIPDIEGVVRQDWRVGCRRDLNLVFRQRRSCGVMSDHAGHAESATVARCFAYQSTVSRTPSPNDTSGSYPSRSRATLISASESRTSPSRAGSKVGLREGPDGVTDATQ